MAKGWRREPIRHGLSSRGIKTAVDKSQALFRTIPSPNLSKNNLPVQVSILVPSTELDKSISELEFAERVESEKAWFNKHFGASTSIKDVGSYKLKGKTINEKGYIVESSMSVETYNKKRRTLENHSVKRVKDWKQDTILISVEGQKFTTPKKSYIDDDKKQNNKIMVT